MNRQSILAAAKTIWATWAANSRIPFLDQEYRPTNRSDAYLIQAEVMRQSGQSTYGWKIAATSPAGQKHIGVDGPLAGRLLDKRVILPGQSVPLVNNIMRVAEAEFAFKMARDLPPRSTPYSVPEVLDAADTLHPAIEIPDSRFQDFASVGAPQLIADNACACYFVLGAATASDWRIMNLPQHTVRARVNENTVREGKGANVLGDPRIALTWLANELSSIGETLAAGQIVTTGTCVVPFSIAQGDQVVMDFGPIGSVECLVDQ